MGVLGLTQDGGFRDLGSTVAVDACLTGKPGVGRVNGSPLGGEGSGTPKDKQVMVETWHRWMQQTKNWRAIVFNIHLQWRVVRQGILKTLMLSLVPTLNSPFSVSRSHIARFGACPKTASQVKKKSYCHSSFSSLQYGHM